MKIFIKKHNGRSAGRKERVGKYACSEQAYKEAIKEGDHCPQYRVLTNRPVVIGKNTAGVCVLPHQQSKELFTHKGKL